ncbi:glycosyltransferase family 1 protein [Skermania sp. ID1734]|uniref:glycosyltransferase family 4 protein n=1 Tax=Skermania sp. ID1734 TaxID=2597516 RepID=UPI002104A98A|nr:glycosyltransferase family 1 protein [Skermania sp. ID1734]
MLAVLGPHICGAQLSALVQRDAIDELPPQVRAVPRPVNSGIRRAITGFAPNSGVNLFHSLDVDIPVTGPQISVSTVHDLSVFDVPWAFGKIRVAGERALLRHAIRRADALIAVSDFTAQRIFDEFRRDAIVIPLAAPSWCRIPAAEEVAAIRKHYGLPERFILHVASIEPRKDIGLVIETAKAAGIPLVLAGAGSDQATLPREVHGLGFVASADLPALYRAASVVAYASHYEGFGLPPLEAMACGAAVVTSAVGAIAESCRGGAVLIEQHDLPTWTRAVKEILYDSDAHEELAAAAPRVAARLSWQQTAQMTAAAYRQVGVDVEFNLSDSAGSDNIRPEPKT